jgi:hypothetical protein
MKNWSRLILPLGLGLLAMAINASAMHNRLATVTLVAVTRDFQRGERLTEADLSPVEFSYPSSHLKNHFWLWGDRDSLLQHLGTPVSLTAGDLVPRQPYQQLDRVGFSIPDKSVLVGVHFGNEVLVPEDRRLLIPGRKVNVRFSDGPEAFGPFHIAFLEPVLVKEKEGTARNAYQMGLILDQAESEALRKLTTSRVNSVIGLAD